MRNKKGEHLEATMQRLQHRAKAIELWLEKNGGAALEEQRHLDAGTTERTYWHHGYMVALRDALSLITGQSPSDREEVEKANIRDTLRLTH